MNYRPEDETRAAVSEILEAFKKGARLSSVDHEIKERGDGAYLIIFVWQPNERLFGALSNVLASLPQDHQFRDRATISKRSPPPVDRLVLPETAALRKEITETLTVSSKMLGKGFLERYIRSVFGAEDQIVARSNHLVFGRRGAGKSSLLLYAMNEFKSENRTCAWVAMQTYDGREDFDVVVDVFIDLLSQLSADRPSHTDVEKLNTRLRSLDSGASLEKAFDKLVPEIRRTLASISNEFGIALFFDDIHVVHQELQPILLAKLYSIARDNNILLKISGIEQLTHNWNPSARKGLELPHDAQVVKLDYNLTMPEKSLVHISSILNAQARYCGLPSIDAICGDGVLPRLVWVAAGVPRDALSIFSDAITRSSLKNQKKVSISSVNEAASVTAEQKLKDMANDASKRVEVLRRALDVVRQFCKTKEKTNAFLVELDTSRPAYSVIQDLIALRLLHVVHEGVTPHEAGKRYVALMLDYGFYVGIRAARSVELFQKEPKPIAAQELRQFPIFPLDSF